MARIFLSEIPQPARPAAVSSAPRVPPKVTAVLRHWQWTKAQAGDAIASAQADAERSKFLDGLPSQVPGVPPDQQAVQVAKQLPAVRAAIAGLAMTPDRARHETQRQDEWEKQTLAQVTSQGTKQYLNQGKQLGLSDFDAKVQAGDIDGALARLTDLRVNHLINDAEYRTQLDRAEAQLRETRLTSAMNAHPRAFNRDIHELHDTGSHPVLGNLIDGPQNAAMWQARSDTQLGKLLTGEQQDLFTGIHGGTITRTDQVQAMVDGAQALDERDLRAAQAALARASGPLDRAKHNDLRVAVAHYDAKADPGYARQAELQRAIAASLPSAEAGKLGDQLKALAQSRPVSANVDAAAKTLLQRLARAGVMGSSPQAAPQLGKHLDGWESYHAAKPETGYDGAHRWVYQELKPYVLGRSAPMLRPVAARFS